VCVYGELLGGMYPHPRVPAVPGLTPVQRGVWYSPALVFFAFDVAVGRRGAAEGRAFLDFAVARKLATAAGFAFAAPLCRGSLQECLEHPVRFSSTVPATLGLPPLSEAGCENLAEGVVVRAACEAAPGGGAKGGARALFKRKIEEFSETQYQNGGWRDAKAGGAGGAGGAGSAGGGASDDVLRFELLAAVTENPLAAVSRPSCPSPHRCRATDVSSSCPHPRPSAPTLRFDDGRYISTSSVLTHAYYDRCACYGRWRPRWAAWT